MHTLSEHRKNLFDVWLQAGSLIFVGLTIAVGIWQYEESNRRDFKKVLWDFQLRKYEEICFNAATVATNPSLEKREEAEAAFWRLYYGDGRMIVDQEVHDRMNAFAVALKKKGRPLAPDNDLSSRAYDIALACRMSISLSWRVPLAGSAEIPQYAR
jgi:hypothetical protein